MSSWFGDGFSSLKGQLSNFAKVLSEEPQPGNSGLESSSAGLVEGQGEDEAATGDPDLLQSGKKSVQDSGGTGWTNVQLIHPSQSPSGSEVQKEEKEIKKSKQEKKVTQHDSTPAHEPEKDVGSIIRGGIANLLQMSSLPATAHSNISRRDQEVQTDLTQDQAASLIVSLQERVDLLTRENESLSQNVITLGRAAAELEAQVAVSQDENANLSTGLEDLDIQHQRAIESILVVRDETQRECAALKVKYSELEEELLVAKSREEEKIKDIEKEKEKERDLIRELEKRDRELECLESENASLRESVRDLMKERDESSKEVLATISELDGEELEALEKQIEQLKKELQSSEDIKNAQEQRLTELNETVLKMNSDMDSLKHLEEQSKQTLLELESEKIKNKELTNQMADLESNLKLISNAKAEAESLIEHLESQMESSNRNVKLNEDFNDTQEQINYLGVLESRLLELRDQKEHLVKECESKDRKMCQILLESNAVEKECRNELEQQQQKYEQLLRECESYREVSEQKAIEIEKLNSRIAVDNEIIVDNAISNEISEKLALLEQENENLLAECGKMKLENNDMILKINNLNEKVENTDKDITAAKNESEILKKRYEFDLRAMESKVNELSQESQQRHIDKEVFNQKEIELKNQLKLKDEEISAFKIFKQQSESCFKEKCSSIENEYKNIIEEKENQLAGFRKRETEFESIKLSLEDKNKSFEETISLREKELTETKDRLDEVLEEKSQLIGEINELKKSYDSLLMQKSQIDSEQYETERETLLRKIESITEQKAQLLSDVVRLNADHSAMKKQLIMSHEEQVQSLQEKLTTAQNEITILKEQISTECADLKKKLTHAEAERDELFKNIQVKHNECIAFQTEVLRLNELLKVEQGKIETLVVEKAQLEMRCEKFKDIELENEANRRDNAELSQEVKRLKEQLDYASDLLKETKRTEAEGQSAEDTTSPKNVKCLEGCEKTLEEMNKLSWALHNEQVNNKTLQRQLADVKEKFEKSEVQLRRLQVHLVEIEQNHTDEQVEMDQMKSKLEMTEERLRQSSNAFTSANIRANQQVESLTHQVQMLTETKEKLEAELSNAEDSVLKQQAAVTNLQAVLHQFQLDKQKDVEFETERLKQQLNESHEKYENVNSEMKKVMDQMNEMKRGLEAASRLSEQLDKKSQVIETLKCEATVLKDMLESERAKVNEIYSSVEGKVDRNLVKNLIVGFISADEKSKSQVLRVLASVLELDTEERKKLALEPQTQRQQQSLSEAFIKFLENESQPKPQLVLSVPPTPEGSASRRTSQCSNSSVLLSTEATTTLSHSPVIPPYTLRSNHSILKDLLKDSTPADSNSGS